MIGQATLSYTSTPTSIVYEEKAKDYDRAKIKVHIGQTDVRTIDNAGASSSTANHADRRTPADLSTAAPQKNTGSIVGSNSRNSVGDVLINAYINRLESLIASWDIPSTSKGIDIQSAGVIIRLSESYLQSLNSYTQYRIFLSTISMSVKTNCKEIDTRKAQHFSRAIADYKKSRKTLDDSKSFSRKIASFGLSPLALEA